MTTEPESNAPLTQSHADRVVSPLASRLRIGLFLVLVGWAFGSALGLSFEGGLPGRHELGAFFFASSRLPPGLVLAVAGWLAWRRLPGFQSVVRGDQARSSGAQAVALLLFALCVFASGWARLTGAADLLLPAFALFLLALASSWAGWAGMRSMALPALLILFGLPIPSPLDNEILWQLQLWSARGAELLLTLFGVAVERVGIHLVSEDTRFLVVESCSGQRAILTLTLVALILRELFEGRGRRQWLLVVIAPPIAYLVNVARIAIIIAGQAGEEVVVADDHIGQGLATLAAGSIALFVIGHFLAGRPSERPPREPIRWETFPGRSGALCLVLLVMASSLLPPWTRPQSIVPDVRAFPGSRGGWQSEVEVVDRRFIGSLPQSELWHRIYELPKKGKLSLAHEVSLYLVVEETATPRRSPWSSKLFLPGRDWELIEGEIVEEYTLGRPVMRGIASDARQRALVYSWTTGSGGLLSDSLRSLLGLESGPFARERARVVVRLAAPIEALGGEGPARQALSRFIHDFRDELRAL